jgi:hypothetical protein
MCTAWDETLTVLALGFDKHLNLNQQRTSWQVMVSLSTIALSVVPADLDKPIYSDSMSVARPPVTLSNTAAAAMWHGLIKIPAAKPFVDACRGFDEHADLAFHTWCRDGAGANSKLTAHLCRSFCTRTLTADKICDLHALKLCLVAVSAVIGSKFTARLYSLALMFRSTTQFFLRLVYSVQEFVETSLEFVKGSPPGDAVFYHNLVIAYVARSPRSLFEHGADVSRNRYVGTNWEANSYVSRTHAARIAAWRELALLLNGRWWVNGMVHYC